jgi:nucleoside-diphosphate-sugar epimerase
MKILITGHEGFIGSNLYHYLIEKNYVVIGLDIKSGNDILTCNLPDCDIVIHLAGVGGVRESIDDPAKYWQNNVEGTKRILDHYSNIRVLVASSSSQYEPYLNPYAASKHIIEKILHSNVCFMRFHTVYGPVPRQGMFFDKLINNTLEYVTTHERDFVHIDDVCEAILLLLKSNIVGPIDVGSGHSIKISDIIQNLPIKDNPPYERKKTLANINLLTSLGFSPKHNVKDFISHYVLR